MTPIRVLLAEDHHIVREGLRLLLDAQPDIRVVGEATTGREAVALATRDCPDVAVLDISMPDLDGVQATRVIRAECPQTRVLILTMYESEAYFFRSLQAGAAGYVLKKTANQDLIGAVRAVARGEVFFCLPMARKLLERLSLLGQPECGVGPLDEEALSDRELEMLLLMAQGFSNQAMAEKLVISPSSVQTHRSHILRKLGIETTADLVRCAIRRGLVEP